MLIKNLLENGRGAVATVGPEAKVAEAAALLAAQHIDVVVVCDTDQKVIGIVTNSDIMRRVANCKPDARLCDISVSEVMVRHVLTCRPGDDLNRVRALMVDKGLRRIPVVDDRGRFIGLASLREALLHLYQKATFEEAELEHYVFGVGYQ